MLKRTSKKIKNDPNLSATGILEQAKGIRIRDKNPAAVALGKLGGLKGGIARAEKLSAERRREIAIKAAKTRWKTTKDSEY